MQYVNGLCDSITNIKWFTVHEDNFLIHFLFVSTVKSTMETENVFSCMNIQFLTQ